MKIIDSHTHLDYGNPEKLLGMAERFRRMEAGLDAALASLRKKDYPGAERVLQDLLTLDQEEKNGL